MTIDRARFDQGLSYDDFKAQMTRNRERLEENEKRVDLAKENVAAFRALPRGMGLDMASSKDEALVAADEPTRNQVDDP